MKRSYALLTLLAVIVIGGVTLREKGALSHAFREVETNARAVSSAYVTIVETELRPLVMHNVLDAQHPAVISAMATGEILKEDLSLDERLAYISRLQLALWDIAQQTPETNATMHMRTQLENHSPVSVLLNAYNATAMHWNQLQDGPWQTLGAHLTGTESKHLPFLRFDGQQEWVPIIQL